MNTCSCTAKIQTELVKFVPALELKSQRLANCRRPSQPLLKWVSHACGIVLGLALFSPAGRAQFAIQELVGGLNNPRALTFGPDGALYIAEAGAPFTADSTTPFIVSARGGQEFYGTNGAIVKYSNNTLTSVLSNLPM